MKPSINLAAVVIDLLGQARKTGGSGRLWWSCPFHADRNPSFCVTPGRSEWRCFGCGARGDAAALLMKLQNVTFPQAVRKLADSWVTGGSRVAGGAGVAGGEWRVAGKTDPADRPAPAARHPSAATPEPATCYPRATRQPSSTPRGLNPSEALALVERGQQRLWSPEGYPFRRALHLRGLNGATIRAARLGWTPGVSIPTRGEIRYYRASGLIIPWFEGDRLAMVKIRQPAGRRPKYVEAFRDRARVFPSPGMVRPGSPLIVVQGELDALLLGQELDGRAAVVTLGLASARPEPDLRWSLLAALPIFAAHDADEAGDGAAASWEPRAIRARPPEPDKDWTDVHRRGGGRIRVFWDARLDLPTDDYDHKERAAILEFDGGLSREDAERATGTV